jgi:surfactin synthase thioesterase subunit
MPKSYELKLREAEERRRPREKAEVYKAVDGKPQRILIGYDHPETLQLEMQLTYCEDTYTIEQTFEHLYAEVRRLQWEYKRTKLYPLRCQAQYESKKYVWFDRFVLRPRLAGRELILQDYMIEPGFRLRLAAFFGGERMWGMPDPHDMRKMRPADQMDASEDPKMLIKIGGGNDNARNRLYCWMWLGGSMTGYIALAKALPEDWVVYALEMPNRGERSDDEGYPTGEFCVEVMTKTLAKVLQGWHGNAYFFAHSQGSNFMYYTTKKLAKEYNIKPKFVALSNFAVPSVAFRPFITKSLRDRNNACVPLRIFISLIKGGWGLDPKLGFRSHTGWMQYQTQELWPAAKMILADVWITRDFPLPRCDEPLPVPVMAFYGKEDTAVSLEMVQEWKGLSSDPDSFEVKVMGGDHMWFPRSVKRSEELAKELVAMAKRFL